MESGTESRDTWANKTEFLLSCLGYAIGIGNVWRFPYLCYRNGGGAFLIPYLLMLFLCGIPLFYLETSLGQFSSTGFLTMFRISPLFKGAGYAIIVVNIICTTYYNVIISYPILFLAHCFHEKLPWSDCTNPWNTQKCYELSDGPLSPNMSYEENIMMKTSADEFFHRKVLQISEDIEHLGTIVWPLFVCDFIVWTVVFLCIMNGVKSVGKVVYFTATFPFVILAVLLVRGLTLPGAWDGIWFYVYPQWHQLTNLKVWADAAIQIFFSLGPGWGGIVNMASYNEFRNNNKADSILVPILNCGTSIFAGFVVFSVLGFMSHRTGLPVSTVVTGGPGLAFVTYPEAISMLPWSNVWAVLFFFMLFLLGLDSCFVQLEALISSITDEYPFLRKHKKMITLLSCISMFLGSLIFVTNGGMYILQLFDWYAASVSVILICFVEVFMVAWTYGVSRFVRDLEFMIGKKLHWWWPFCWKLTNPLILCFIFVTAIAYNTTITYHGVVYPEWSIGLGWCSCAASMIWIPIYIGYKLLYFAEGDLIDVCLLRIKASVKPSKKWGPAREDQRKEWLNIYAQLEDLPLKGNQRPNDDYHNKFLQLCAPSEE